MADYIHSRRCVYQNKNTRVVLTQSPNQVHVEQTNGLDAMGERIWLPVAVSEQAAFLKEAVLELDRLIQRMQSR